MRNGYTSDDLIAVIDWIFESDDDYCKFMRTKGYTTLESLFRVNDVQSKVERALNWVADVEEEAEDGGVNLGFVGRMRRG